MDQRRVNSVALGIDEEIELIEGEGTRSARIPSCTSRERGNEELHGLA